MKAHKCNLESHRAILSFVDFTLSVQRRTSPVKISTRLCRLEQVGNDRFTAWITAKVIVRFDERRHICSVTCYRNRWSCVTVSKWLAHSQTVVCTRKRTRMPSGLGEWRTVSWKLGVVDRTNKKIWKRADATGRCWYKARDRLRPKFTLAMFGGLFKVQIRIRWLALVLISPKQHLPCFEFSPKDSNDAPIGPPPSSSASIYIDIISRELKIFFLMWNVCNVHDVADTYR